MDAVLIFLIIFACATIVSRLGHATLFLRFLIAPTFAALGILLSHHGLGILRPLTLNGLDFFTQSSIAWLSFLLGLRGLSYRNVKVVKLPLRMVQIALIFSATLILVTLTLKGFGEEFIRGLKGENLYLIAIFASALLIGREPVSLNGVRINSFHAAIFSVIGVVPFLVSFFGHRYGDIMLAWFPIAVCSAVAATCFVIQGLILINKQETLSTLVISLIAMSCLIAGVSIWYFVPHFYLGFLFGLLLSLHKKFDLEILRELFLTEQPVRMVLMILIGAQLKISLGAVILGVALGLMIYFMRLALHAIFDQMRRKKTMFSSFMGSSDVAVMFSASLWFVLPAEFLNDFVVLILVSSSIGDILGVARWSIILQKRLYKKQSLAAEL